LCIQDDGLGFEPEKVRGRGSLGLIGMEERARLVKGKLSVTSHPGQGTRLRIEIPFPNDIR
jgi:two-component system, sensor kinase